MKITYEEIASFQKKMNRARFMPGNEQMAGIDAAFSIGYDQTISQPSLVLYMTALLKMNDTSRVLEVGTGSGYQTAMLAQFAQKIFTVERIKPLYELAKTRLQDMGYENISYLCGDGTLGWDEHSPFDRIMVTAAAEEIPQELIDQLAVDGRMVIPAGRSTQNIYLITKDQNGNVQITKDLAVRFVPLIRD
jgi:protein-L-isoaspartate(D-aspartate) O-methyltransferase